MNSQTDTPVPRVPAGTTIALVLFADAGLHLLWATGSTWPASTEQQLSLGLLGFAVDFRPSLLISLAAILISGATLVLARQRHPREHRLDRVWQLGAAAVVTGLLLRGVVGLVWLIPPLSPEPPAFRWLNAFLYTPLCLALGGLGRRLLRKQRLDSPVRVLQTDSKSVTDQWSVTSSRSVEGTLR